MTSTAQLPERTDGEAVTVGGMITEIKKIIDKKGHQMAFVTVEDLTGPVEVIVFASVFERCSTSLQPEAIVVVRGRVNYKDEDQGPKILADAIEPLASAKVEAVYVDIPAELENSETLERLKAVLGLSQGNSPVYLRFLSCGQLILTDKECWIRPDPDALAMLADIIGASGVTVVAM
jgi:DNA polymerase-3 subunit alpha